MMMFNSLKDQYLTFISHFRFIISKILIFQNLSFFQKIDKNEKLRFCRSFSEKTKSGRTMKYGGFKRTLRALLICDNLLYMT